MELRPQPVKNAVRRLPLVDSYFGNRYSFSPYRGCVHACAYCDGRSERYYVEGNFEKDIVVRRNLPEKLAEELPKLRERGFILAGSGVTDPYQPAEADEKLMSRAAEILLRGRHPALLTTKNALAARDLPLWKQLAEKNGFVLLMTLASLSEEERQIYEPGASAVEERLDVFRQFKARGIPLGVMLMPLLPRLWDTEVRLSELLDRVKEIGADFVLPGALTLRPGVQKSAFLEVLSSSRPDLLPDYQKLYSENRPSGSPVSGYSRELRNRLSRLLQEREIPFLMPHGLFRGRISRADEIHLLIRHLAELYSARGVDVRPVRAAEERYTRWLIPRRQEFNRRRSLPPDHLSCQIELACRNREMGRILDNRKLGRFIEDLIEGGGILNYQTLRIC